MDKEDEIAEELFLEELKSEYSKGLELKDTLDSKANSILTVSIASSTLLITVGIFLLSSISLSTIFLGPLLLLFGAGIVFAVLAIFYSLRSFEIKDYYFAVKEFTFFDNEGTLIEEEINKERFKKKTEFIGDRIKDYLICLKENIRKNQEKADKIKHSQRLFTISVSLISAFLVTLLISVAIDALIIRPLP